MNKKRKILITSVIGLIAGLTLISADHIDAPEVAGGASDITDFYAFQGQDTNNLVFVANVQGLISPGSTANASFSENTLIEFNIDNDGDNAEDLVIQAIPRGNKMYFFGPSSPTTTGLNSTILQSSAYTNNVAITNYGQNAVIENNDGMMFFAGPRDDPFFMDFAQYSEIIAGNATSFNDPGTDTFAGTNVLSVVVEVPKSLLGSSATLNTWVEVKNK
ncbi:DUF4331 family protein [Pseudofulvibacter geojedonensis]|uniref:DUF4331 family protein n=1 Tax=Pseudofulvibacter geojedonensis TaxID=1123758 RepID=A0ABW3I0F3_9FLAO